MNLNVRRMLCALGLACVAAPIQALAQFYPSKPIRIIVTVLGGGEVISRLVTTKASESLGQPIVPEVQAGAGGSIGAQTVARAAPDGYTILYSTANAQLYRVFLAKNTPYDPVKDFTPIAKLGESTLVIATYVSAPYKNLADAVAFAKQNPGKMFYATSGVGTTHHLSAELISQIAGLQMVHVPYKDGANATGDLISGRVPMLFATLSTMTPYLAAAKARLLAVNTRARSSLVPEVPTAGELVPGYEPPPGWSGYFGPRGLPDPIVRRLSAEIVKAANLPEIRAKLEALGLVVTPSTPEELGESLKRDFERTGRLVKAIGIQPE
jgi:tripartite-type tricarboxylate transporter receptor subunit TctC